MASGGLSLIRSLVLSLRFFYLFIYYHDFFFDGIGSKRRHFEWRDNLSWLAPLSHWKFPRIKYRFIWLIFTLTQRLRSDIIPKIYFWEKNHCTNPKCKKRTLLKKLRFFMWLLSFGWVLSFFFMFNPVDFFGSSTLQLQISHLWCRFSKEWKHFQLWYLHVIKKRLFFQSTDHFLELEK